MLTASSGYVKKRNKIYLRIWRTSEREPCYIYRQFHRTGPSLGLYWKLQRSAKRRGCLISYSQAEPGIELTQPRTHLLAEPCIHTSRNIPLCQALSADKASGHTGLGKKVLPRLR